MSGIKEVITKVKAQRSLYSSLLEVVGFIALVYGVAVFSLGVAFIVGGTILIVVGGLSA
jgi:hypothetical protein